MPGPSHSSHSFTRTIQLLFLYSTFFRYLRKKKKHNEAVHQLVINCEKTYYSFSSVFLYNTVNQFGIHMTLVRVIKLYLNETYCRYRLGKYCVTCFVTRIFEKKNSLLQLVFKFSLQYAFRNFQINKECLKLNGAHQLLVSTKHFNKLVVLFFPT